MKWIFLLAALASIVPLSGWLRKNRDYIPKIWFVIGLLLFVLDPLHLFMAVISWAYWPGFVKGLEVTIIDIVAMAIYLSLPTSRQLVPFKFIAAVYLVSVVLSAFQSGAPQATMFYAWQLVRMCFLFAVTTRSCAADERVAPSLLNGMAVGICLELCVGLWQRFVLGEIQVGGTFGHQNSLGMASYFVTIPMFALFLAGKRGWIPVVVSIAGVLIALLTASRATLGLGALGYALMFTFSVIRKWTLRKGGFGLVAIVLVAVLAPVAFSALDKRFSVNPLSDEYDERAAFESAAAAILSDHPMGIGANDYVVVANTQGYNDRAGVAWSEGSREAHVHNAYRLVAAETGYLGLIAFVLLLLRPIIVALTWGWRSRRDLRGDLLLGLGVSLFLVSIHSFFEWVLLTYHLQYFVAVQAGMIVGLAQQVGYGQKAAARNIRVASATFPRNLPQ